MNVFWKAYKFISILSIDVAIGAVCSCLFFAKFFHVSLRTQGIATLGITVWMIYTADHLVDARRLQEPASTERHRFHQQYFKLLTIALAIAAMIDLACVISVRTVVFKWGIMLAAIVLIYLLLQRRMKFLKELFGGILYTGGVLLPVMAVNTESIGRHQLLVIVQFFLTALCNLILFSWFDSENDLKDKHPSLVTFLGSAQSKRLLLFLFSLQAILIFFTVTNPEGWIILIMNGVLLILFLFNKYFRTHDRYRVLGDAIFFLPLLYCL